MSWSQVVLEGAAGCVRGQRAVCFEVVVGRPVFLLALQARTDGARLLCCCCCRLQAKVPLTSPAGRALWTSAALSYTTMPVSV